MKMSDSARVVVESGRLAQRHIGPGTELPPMPDPPEGFTIRVTPTRVRGMGPGGTQL